MNKVNLLKLADYLESDKLTFGFDMNQFKDDENECGTVGCAIGHAAVLFPKIFKNHTYKSIMQHGAVTANYFPFGEEVFEISTFDTCWDYMFCGLWCEVDNTPKGTAKRIREVVAGKDLSEWYMDDEE